MGILCSKLYVIVCVCVCTHTYSCNYLYMWIHNYEHIYIWNYPICTFTFWFYYKHLPTCQNYLYMSCLIGYITVHYTITNLSAIVEHLMFSNFFLSYKLDGKIIAKYSYRPWHTQGLINWIYYYSSHIIYCWSQHPCV